uniref:Cell cycle associated protein 1b n=1 Tax=Esox lucius TaxID=8010 RepID=A0A6Q2YRA6_ESOLU
MPSAMNGNRTVQSASPDVGSVSGQITQGGQSSGAQTEAMKQVLGVIDKKVRNMEKKKGKLDDYQARKNKGERLNQDQLDALTKYQEVANNLEFARELQKSFLTLGQDIQKAVKKAARREQLKREEAEQKRLKTVLEVQFLLDRLGEDAVRQELRQGSVAGAPSLLTDAELTALDDLYKLVGPERDQNARLADQYEEASQHFMDLLEGKDKAVAGTTYKALKESLDRVLLSGYFDKAQSRQNGVCEEEEDEEEEEEEEESAIVVVESSEFVNRQFIPDATYSSSDKDQGDQWSTETEAISPTQQQPVESSPPPVALETHPLNGAPPAVRPADPVVRKQAVQDLLSQMQGPYNFMQVFNLNAPVPPANETEALNVASQYQNSYSQQGFNQSQQLPVEQTEQLQTEQLQSVVGSFHPQDQALSQPQQGVPGFVPGTGRQAQSFYNSRGMTRGGPRNARGIANGYRGPSNGFRGGYDGYRPPFANAPNSGYQQAPFNTPRDYSNGGNYQRGDGYNQSYKRGTGQGPRGASRGGSAQPVRS